MLKKLIRKLLRRKEKPSESLDKPPLIQREKLRAIDSARAQRIKERLREETIEEWRKRRKFERVIAELAEKQRPRKAVHQPVEKFMKPSKRTLPSYRKSTKAKVKPEEEE